MGFDASQSLVGKSLQPKYSAAIRIRQQLLVKLIPDDVRYLGDIATQHTLDMPPRTFPGHLGQAAPRRPGGRQPGRRQDRSTSPQKRKIFQPPPALPDSGGS